MKEADYIEVAERLYEYINPSSKMECPNSVYITSEKVFYTIQYAKYANINLIIGSHTFTESFGIESLAEKIKNNFEDIEIVKIKEEHIEY